MSRKHSDQIQRENAIKGALRRQCPGCKRKAALSKDVGVLDGKSYIRRYCRWCSWEQTTVNGRPLDP